MIGMVAGAGYTSMEHMLVSWQIDDPVGSFPVHYVGGFLGVILTPIFANHEQPYSWVYWKGKLSPPKPGRSQGRTGTAVPRESNDPN